MLRTLLCFLLIFISNFALAKPSHDFDLSKMSLEEKVGQLFILGFEGQQLSSPLKNHIKSFKPGGLIYFSKNLKGLKHDEIKYLNSQMLREFKKQNLFDPFLSVDQEGALVSRVKTNNKLPNALSVGSTQNPQFSYQFGEAIGNLLSSLLFNLNYAPVLDVANPFEKTFIGVRSFGSDPFIVAQHGEQFSRGLLSQGVLPTAKHFPGTGSLKMDPHLNFASILMSFEELKKLSLPPFESFSKIDPSAVMISHVSFPSIDRSRMPSSFSNTLNHGLIRNQLQYKGLIITDDLMMDGAFVGQDIRSRVVKSLYAGSDMIMITWSSPQQILAKQAILEALKYGDIDEAFIDEKVSRILRVKSQLKNIKSSNTLAVPYENQIRSLNQSILNSQLSNLNLRSPATLQNKTPFVVISRSLFKNQLFKKQSLHRKDRLLLRDFPNSNAALQKLVTSLKNSHKVIIHNESASQHSWLKSFFQEPQVSIINSSYPGLLNHSNPSQIVNLYMNHTHLDSALFDLL